MWFLTPETPLRPVRLGTAYGETRPTPPGAPAHAPFAHIRGKPKASAGGGRRKFCAVVCVKFSKLVTGESAVGCFRSIEQIPLFDRKRPSLRSLIAVQKASGFPLSAMLPTMSAHLAVERLEARGLVGTARSSPQPPLAVARRARLEVVGPTRQHRTKRWMRILSARWVIMRRPLRTAGSTVLFAVHYRFGRNIASGVRRRHVPNEVCRCSCRRNDAVAGARPGRDSTPPWSAADLVLSHAEHHAACSKRNSIL
jgi:hypothetical protein